METNEERVTGLLKAAWSCVDAAGLPEPVQATALQIAASAISAAISPTSLSIESGTEATSAEGGSPRTPQLVRGVEADGLGDEDIFATLHQESGVAEDDLRRVYSLKEGSLHVSVARSALGANEAAKNRTIATLVLGARYFAEGKKEVSIGEIRAAAKALRHEPSRNLTTHLDNVAGTIATGTGSDRSVRVQEARFQGAFESAIAAIVGEQE